MVFIGAFLIGVAAIALGVLIIAGIVYMLDDGPRYF